MIATLLTQVNSRRIHIFHIPAEMSAFIQLIERHIQSRSHQPQSILILFTPAPHMLNWVPMLTRWHPGLMTSQIHPYVNPVRVLWRHLQATTNSLSLIGFHIKDTRHNSHMGQLSVHPFSFPTNGWLSPQTIVQHGSQYTYLDPWAELHLLMQEAPSPPSTILTGYF